MSELDIEINNNEDNIESEPIVNNTEFIIQDVYANPFDELPIKTEKYASSYSDLYLGKRNINKLNDFERFQSLETLWLNNNKIKSLDGLQYNYRLKYLYLHYNEINYLDINTFKTFKYLKILKLNNNQLIDLNNVINTLKVFIYLEVLDLYNNPIENISNYRIKVISELTCLQIFDKLVISDKERNLCVKYKKKFNNNLLVNDFNINDKIVDESTDINNTVDEIKRKDILKEINKYIYNYRINLNNHFKQYDKRNIGILSIDELNKIIYHTTINNILSNNDINILISYYKDIRPLLSTFDITTDHQTYGFNYHKFINDMTNKPVNSHDIIVNNLIKLINKNKLKYDKNEKEKFQNSIFSNAIIENGNSSKATLTLKPHIYNPYNDYGLNPWIINEISKYLSKEYSNNSMILDRTSLSNIFNKILLYGKIPISGIDSTIEQLLELNASITLKQFNLCFGIATINKNINPMNNISKQISKSIKSNSIRTKIDNKIDNLLDNQLTKIIFRDCTYSELVIISNKLDEKMKKSNNVNTTDMIDSVRINEVISRYSVNYTSKSSANELKLSKRSDIYTLRNITKSIDRKEFETKTLELSNIL